MNNLYEELKGLSMTGRLCYLFMCLEKYLITCYPERDWTPVAKRCWQWTNGTWDIGCDIYSPVVPEFLLEFDNYEEANRRAFDGNLSESDYLALVNLYDGLTTGNEDDEINQVLMLPIEFSSECEGSAFMNADEPTLVVLNKAQEFLLFHQISIPSICKVKNMTVDEKNGWGDYCDSEYLSIIINA